MQISWILVSLVGFLSRSSGAPAGDYDGSQCPNVSCSPPIPGAQCNPKYERDDGCCPVWYCYNNNNGAVSTIYGKNTGGSSSSSWQSSSSYGDNGMSGNGMQWNNGGGMMTNGGNNGRFPGFQMQLPNLNFGNLFGR